jgi:hypothetical protein
MDKNDVDLLAGRYLFGRVIARSDIIMEKVMFAVTALSIAIIMPFLLILMMRTLPGSILSTIGSFIVSCAGIYWCVRCLDNVLPQGNMALWQKIKSVWPKKNKAQS